MLTSETLASITSAVQKTTAVAKPISLIPSSMASLSKSIQRHAMSSIAGSTMHTSTPKTIIVRPIHDNMTSSPAQLITTAQTGVSLLESVIGSMILCYD